MTREPGTSGPVEEPTPARFCRLLSEVNLVEETRLSGAGVPSDLRMLLLLGGAQPGPAIGMTLALGRIRRVDRDSVVGFFPSLRRVAELGPYDRAVSFAYQVAAQNPTHLILVGTPPRNCAAGSTDSVAIGRPCLAARQAIVVDGLGRHPRVAEAKQPLLRPFLWNVSMTVGTVDAFRVAFLATQPSLAVAVDAIAAVKTAEVEGRAVADAWASHPGLSVSDGTSTTTPRKCLVVPLTGEGTDMPLPGWDESRWAGRVLRP